MYDKERRQVFGSFQSTKKGLARLFIDQPINMTEFFALNSIRKEENMTKLAESLKINKSAVSQMLASLEKKELIVRSVNKDDRRKNDVTITPKGEQLVLHVNKLHRNIISNTFESIGLDKTVQLASLLEEFSIALDENTTKYLETQK